MKKTILLLCVAALFASCNTPNNQSADEIDQHKQEALQKEATSEIGMPDIHNFQEKKMVKMLYELRDNPNVINYAYLWSEVSGKWIYLGKCVGYGIPYSTQFSSPSKLVRADLGQYTGNLAMPQAEPNGLFMPASSQGTWLMMINPNNAGDIKPVYVEPSVIVSPFKLPNS
jgi:hypothetical protein